jgi:hypothetical protein
VLLVLWIGKCCCCCALVQCVDRCRWCCVLVSVAVAVAVRRCNRLKGVAGAVYLIGNAGAVYCFFRCCCCSLLLFG